MNQLPAELILHVCLFLEARDILPLHLVSKRFFAITRANRLWKELCFVDSYSEAARKRREFLSGVLLPIQEPGVYELQRVLTRSANENSNLNDILGKRSHNQGTSLHRNLSNWDPSYPGEKIDWYEEYVARHSSLTISWFQQPLNNDSRRSKEKLEARGLGFLDRDQEELVIAPLDDGSVCIWNLGEDSIAANDNGKIISRSTSGLLSVDALDSSTWQRPSTSRAKMTSTGAVECVSIDHFRNKAYFAVQSGLNEVDLSTLQRSDYSQFPHSISALSEAAYGTPLTVGTTLSLHIHDPRTSNRSSSSSYAELTDTVDTEPIFQRPSDFYRITSGDSQHETYATLFQPSPLSIIHHNPSSMIYVAGRFPSILTYDRRYFPRLHSTIHSGARLCSLASLPSPDHPTLIAGGEYKGKGSVELYPLPSPSSFPSPEPRTTPIYNRTSASSSKILSIVPHGSRLLFSDSGGQLKWVERDGSTLVRRWNINEYLIPPEDIGRSEGIWSNSPNEGDVVRKLLPVSKKERSDILLWTGEKVGVLSFGRKPRFSFRGGDGVDDDQGSDVDSGYSSLDERDYARVMRRALERQADEVRFVRGLGLGGGGP